jgi:hypothetical protein
MRDTRNLIICSINFSRSGHATVSAVCQLRSLSFSSQIIIMANYYYNEFSELIKSVASEICSKQPHNFIMIASRQVKEHASILLRLLPRRPLALSVCVYIILH